MLTRRQFLENCGQVMISGLCASTLGLSTAFAEVQKNHLRIAKIVKSKWGGKGLKLTLLYPMGSRLLGLLSQKMAKKRLLVCYQT